MLKEEQFKEKKETLQLSYINPNLWWKRKYDTNSSEWRRIRLEVLFRDNHACFFCKVRASKYMIVDHISGNAMDNSLENLRVLCPMCDTIRHSGLAGIEETLKIGISKLSQLEIVESTRKIFIERKRVPRMKEIDPEVIETAILPIEVAVEENKEKPIEWKKYKGFFTRNFFEKKITARFLRYLEKSENKFQVSL